MSDEQWRERAHNFGNTQGLFICEADGHCAACKAWGDFAIRTAERAVEDY